MAQQWEQKLVRCKTDIAKRNYSYLPQALVTSLLKNCNECLWYLLPVEYDIEQDIEFKIDPDWENRVNFTWPDGNITMYSIDVEDDGRYQCQGRIGDQWGIETFTDIHVYGKYLVWILLLQIISILWYSFFKLHQLIGHSKIVVNYLILYHM